jgi:glutaminase
MKKGNQIMKETIMAKAVDEIIKKANTEQVLENDFISADFELDLIKIFKSIDHLNRGFITSRQLWDALSHNGIYENDPRLRKTHEKINSIQEKIESDKKIDFTNFKALISESSLVRNALLSNLSIPDFVSLCDDIEEIFDSIKDISSGKVADYIPQLARVNPDYFAVSICTIDGQRFSKGDSKVNFCLQSTCKSINYAIIHEDLGENIVHNHVGKEPSGLVFNELSLNSKGLPHNPLINSGAIMACSMIKRDFNISDRFDYVTNTWKDLTGGGNINFNNSVYLSERQTADRNFALAYFMRENQAFMPDTDLLETLEFYFQCCSIELDAEAMAVAAATFANAGVCPLTNKRIFSSKTIRNSLSLMSSCGMYNFSGEFAFQIGLPAKSGVSGALMVVVPNVMGICIWSPRLDTYGNSVKGIEFCRKLIDLYNFHAFDILSNDSQKKNPTNRKYESKSTDIISLIWAATYGDLSEIQRLEARGIDLNLSDYDGRTALHLAAAEGNLNIVKYLIEKKANVNPLDRWGGNPLKDAMAGNHSEVIAFLKTNGGI